MKLHLDPTDGAPRFTSYGAHFVDVNGRRFETSVIVCSWAIDESWPPATVADLSVEDCAAIAALDPEVVLLGTGEHQCFPDPAVLEPLYRNRIGTETMDTGAVCRTYNILAAEGRRVVAALLLGG